MAADVTQGPRHVAGLLRQHLGARGVVRSAVDRLRQGERHVAQRQRIGLARALYQDPFVVLLDEPNASLDAVGERALNDTIKSIRARGGIVIVIAHPHQP